jgi:hypothetical protein
VYILLCCCFLCFLKLKLQPDATPKVTWNWKFIIEPKHPGENPTVGCSFVITQLQQAGLISQPEQRLFVSAEVVRLFKALDTFIQSTQRGMIIKGSPGLGKSCTTWAWVCAQGLQNGKQVLWIHVAKYTDAACVSISGRSCTACLLKPAALEELLEISKADIVVFDGYGPTLGGRFEDCITALMNRELNFGRKVIIVSSLGIFLKASYFGLGINDLGRFDMNPWTFEEYAAACSDSTFFKSVRQSFESTADEISEDLLYEKYFFAGASARWMFEMNTKDIRSEINMYLSAVPNAKALLCSTASVESSNHLLMRTGCNLNECTFTWFYVSKFAMQQAMRKFNTKGIKLAYELSTQNRNISHFGWVLELDFALRLVAAANGSNQFPFLDEFNSPVSWKVSNTEYFDESAQILESWALDHWKIPNSTRRAGFDAACLFQTNSMNILRVVLVICAKTDSIQMDAFASLIGQIAKSSGVIITGLEVVIMRPKFADKRIIAMPSLAFQGKGQCSMFHVGASDSNWQCGQEHKQVLYYGFEVPIHFFSELQTATARATARIGLGLFGATPAVD